MLQIQTIRENASFVIERLHVKNVDSTESINTILALDADNFPTTYLNWTPYSQNTEVTFNNLDEGKFRFQVQGRSSGIEPDPVKLDFYVDAVEGPSLLFYKTKTKY